MRCSAPIARLALTITCVLSIAAAVDADERKADLLLNGGAEKGKGELPSIWFAACVPADGLRMWQCTANPREGKACLAISNRHEYEQTVANNWAQRLQDVPTGRTIRLSAHIRTEDADAANVCVQCWAKDGKKMLAFASTPVFRGTDEWTLVRAPQIVVPSETAFIIVRAALTGQGEAFFDNISLDVVDPQASPPAEAELGEAAPDKAVGASSPRKAELDKAVPGTIVRTAPVSKDCMVLSYMPGWAHGEVDNLAVANNGGGVRTLLAWPAITSEEASRADLKFFLALYSRKTTSKPSAGVVEAHELLANWPERISWQKRPAVSAEPISTAKFAPGDGWKLFDVTPLVRATAKERRKTSGVILRFAKEDRSGTKQNWSGYQFVSREGLGKWKSRRPLLVVVEATRKPAASVEQVRPTSASGD